MVYLYKYSAGGVLRYAHVVNGNTFSRMTVYSSDLLTTLKTYAELASTKTANFSKFAVTSIIFNSEKIPVEMCQYDKVFFECLLVKSIQNKLFSGEKIIAFTLDDGTDVTFNLISELGDFKVSRVNVYKDNLRYNRIDEKTQNEFGLVKRLSSLATIEDMKNRYNCSWVFNDDGTMKKDYRSITTEEELAWLKSELAALPDDYFVGYDVETSGLNVYYMPDKPEEKDRLLGFSLAWKDDQGVYIPLESKVFEHLTKARVFEVLYDELVRLHIIAHNGMFEWKVNYDNGRTITINEDTLILDFNIYPETEAGFKTLKNLTRYHFGDETWEFKQLFGGKADPSMLVYLPLDLITIYGCADSDYARKLYYKLKSMLNKSQEFCYKLDVALIELLAKSEYYGVAIDDIECNRQETALQEDLNTLEVVMESYIREYGFVKYRNRKIVELLNLLKEKYPSATKNQYYNYINNHVSEDKLKEEYNKYIDSLFEKKIYTSSKVLIELMFGLLEYPVFTYTTQTKAQRRKRKEKEQQLREQGLPVPEYKPMPSTGEDQLLILVSYNVATPSTFLKEDVKSADEKAKKPLLSADYINKLEYPFAAMLLEHKRITKLLTTFFKQRKANNSHYLYNENFMTAAATARLISTVQTIAGNSKKMVIPYPNTYGINADYSQIEVRNMAGCANEFWQRVKPLIDMEELSIYHRDGIENYIKSLNNPETDIHRLTASNMLGIAPELINKEQRSGAKRYTFGIPYDMQSYSLSEGDRIKYVDALSSTAADLTEMITMDNGIGINKWSFANYPIYQFLEFKRKQALTPVIKDEEWIDHPDGNANGDIIPCYYEGHTVGYVSNPYGRRRYFYLDSVSGQVKGEIERASGNYPIQSGARDLFFINKMNMYSAMKREGLINNPTNGEKPELDQFTMTAFVHDEFFGYANLNLHPYKMVRLIYNNCFVKVKCHPVYFMGVNFVNTWYDGKAGTNELPVPLVKSIAMTDEKDWPEFVDGYFHITDKLGKRHKLWVVDYFAVLKKQWEFDRVLKEISDLSGVAIGDKTTPMDWNDIAFRLTNYAVKPLIVSSSDLLGATKDMNGAARLEMIWNNYDFDCFTIKVKESRLSPESTLSTETGENDHFEDEVAVSGQTNFFTDGKSEAGVETDEEDFDLFSEEAAEDMFSDLTADLMPTALDVQSKAEAKRQKDEKILNQYIGQNVKFYDNKLARSKYITKNYQSSGKFDPRVIIMITGKVLLKLDDISPINHPAIIKEIKERFEDPNGSLIEVVTGLGVKRLPFRVFGYDRKELERILAKYSGRVA